jgi:hypothetical protein
MIIDCIGCLHGYQPKLDCGDILIVTGDLTARGTLEEYLQFNVWLKEQDYKIKLVIAGNHDPLVQSGFECKIADDYIAILKPILANGCVYLEDSGAEFDKIKVWGSPWSLWFDRINPEVAAFTGREEDLIVKYAKIPDDIDIFISHSPFFGVLDENRDGLLCGSKALRNAIDRIKPRLFICSHIHEQGGNQLMYKHVGVDTWCINCSIMDADYRPKNKPVRITI